MTGLSLAHVRRACLAGAAGLATFAMPALAANEGDIIVRFGDAGSVTRQVAVSSAGLDLSSPQGRALLDRRIKRATQEVCDYSSMHGLQPPAAYTECANVALDTARRQVGRLAARSSDRASGN